MSMTKTEFQAALEKECAALGVDLDMRLATRTFREIIFQKMASQTASGFPFTHEQARLIAAEAYKKMVYLKS
jgi:hypothetical protein